MVRIRDVAWTRVMREGLGLQEVAAQLGVAPQRLERILIAFGRRRAALLSADMDAAPRRASRAIRG